MTEISMPFSARFSPAAAVCLCKCCLTYVILDDHPPRLNAKADGPSGRLVETHPTAAKEGRRARLGAAGVETSSRNSCCSMWRLLK